MPIKRRLDFIKVQTEPVQYSRRYICPLAAAHHFGIIGAQEELWGVVMVLLIFIKAMVGGDVNKSFIVQVKLFQCLSYLARPGIC
jgi:hypothetical protein